MNLKDLELSAQSIKHVVKESDLATSWKNDVPVLATPVLLWLAELAAMKVMDGFLPKGSMSVGISHTMKHLAPTPLGLVVIIEAKALAVSDRIISFDIMAHDGVDIVLKGTHERAIVERELFLKKIESKSST